MKLKVPRRLRISTFYPLEKVIGNDGSSSSISRSLIVYGTLGGGRMKGSEEI